MSFEVGSLGSSFFLIIIVVQRWSTASTAALVPMPCNNTQGPFTSALIGAEVFPDGANAIVNCFEFSSIISDIYEFPLMSDSTPTFLGTGIDDGILLGAMQGDPKEAAFPGSLLEFGQNSQRDNFLQSLLSTASDLEVSDIHFSELEGEPVFRVARTCVRFPKGSGFPDLRDNFDKVVHSELLKLCRTYAADSSPYDNCLRTSFKLGHVMVRVSCYKSENRRVAAFRLQPLHPRELGGLGLSRPLIATLSDPSPGLVLISGGTSCGKSSTLASLVQFYISQTDHHIRTLEDPFEYEYLSGTGYLTRQRVSKFGDVSDYETAVEGSLSHDVNVLVFGELRDDQSVRQAVFASGLNMLVIATIHAQDVSGTIARVLAAYSPSDRPELLRSLGASLKAVVAQKIQLVLKKPTLVYESAVFAPKLQKGSVVPDFSKYFKDDGYAQISEDAARQDYNGIGWSSFVK